MNRDVSPKRPDDESTPDWALALTLTRDIAAPPREVWRVLTDVEDSAEHLSGVEAVEVLTDGEYRTGTRWRETRRMFGRRETQEMTVTDAVAPKHTTITADSHGHTYTTTFTLQPTMHGAHTRITMDFSGAMPEGGRLQRLLSRVLGPMALKATRQAMVQDLADIAALAEQRPDVRH